MSLLSHVRTTPCLVCQRIASTASSMSNSATYAQFYAVDSRASTSTAALETYGNPVKSRRSARLAISQDARIEGSFKISQETVGMSGNFKRRDATSFTELRDVSSSMRPGYSSLDLLEQGHPSYPTSTLQTSATPTSGSLTLTRRSSRFILHSQKREMSNMTGMTPLQLIHTKAHPIKLLTRHLDYRCFSSRRRQRPHVDKRPLHNGAETAEDATLNAPLSSESAAESTSQRLSFRSLVSTLSQRQETPSSPNSSSTKSTDVGQPGNRTEEKSMERHSMPEEVWQYASSKAPWSRTKPVDSQQEGSQLVDSQKVQSPKMESPKVESQPVDSQQVNRKQVNRQHADNPQVGSQQVERQEVQSQALNNQEVDSQQVYSQQADSQQVGRHNRHVSNATRDPNRPRPPRMTARYTGYIPIRIKVLSNEEASLRTEKARARLASRRAGTGAAGSGSQAGVQSVSQFHNSNTKSQQSENAQITLPKVRRRLVDEQAKTESDNPDSSFVVYASAVAIDPLFTLRRDRIPQLAHDLHKTLHNPGIHWLQRPTSGNFNFASYLQKPLKREDFDFTKLARFVRPSDDEELSTLLKTSGRRFAGSTSSLTSAFSQIYFALNGRKLLNTQTEHFVDMPRSFTKSIQVPVSIVLVLTGDGTYLINADKDTPNEMKSTNVLSDMGHVFEKLLTCEMSHFERYRKDSADPISLEESRDKREAYHYSATPSMVMRSQLDCWSPHLRKKTFDVKTRATVAIRYDQLNHESASDYRITKGHGSLSSFEREKYDLVRSAFLKYSMQVRIGNMDGIFIAYHSISTMFGFEYMPLKDIDELISGSHEESSQAFALCVAIFEQMVNRIVSTFPGRTLGLNLMANSELHTVTIIVHDKASRLPLASYEIGLTNCLNGEVLDAQEDVDFRSLDSHGSSSAGDRRDSHADSDSALQHRHAEAMHAVPSWTVIAKYKTNLDVEHNRALLQSIYKKQSVFNKGVVLPEGLSDEEIAVCTKTGWTLQEAIELQNKDPGKYFRNFFPVPGITYRTKPWFITKLTRLLAAKSRRTETMAAAALPRPSSSAGLASRPEASQRGIPVSSPPSKKQSVRSGIYKSSISMAPVSVNVMPSQRLLIPSNYLQKGRRPVTKRDRVKQSRLKLKVARESLHRRPTVTAA